MLIGNMSSYQLKQSGHPHTWLSSTLEGEWQESSVCFMPGSAARPAGGQDGWTSELAAAPAAEPEPPWGLGWEEKRDAFALNKKGNKVKMKFIIFFDFFVLFFK